MPDSREIEKRIEEVLMEHGRRIDPNHPGYGNCRCGFVVDLPQDQAAHVAAAVVTELAMSQQWSVEIDIGTGRVRCEPTPFPPRGDLAPDDLTLTRFVTGWEPVEEPAPDPHAGGLWANELHRRQRQVPADREWS